MNELYSYGFLLLALFITTSEAIQCLSCDNVVEARDCKRLATCSSHEICYVQRKIGTNLKQYYVLGCIDRNVCLGQQASMFAMGKRDTVGEFIGQIEANADESRALQSRDKMTRDANGDMNLCTQCCERGDGCNKDLCGSPPTTNLRCLSCNDKEDPKNCESVKECSRDQFCFVHKGLNPNIATFAIRYSLGCMGELQCNAFKRIYQQSCVVCCNHTDLCNYAACDHWSPGITPTHAHVPTKPPTTITPTLPPPSVTIQGQDQADFLQETQLNCVTNPAADTYTWKFNGTTSLPIGVTTKLLTGSTGSGSNTGSGIESLHISNLTESTFGTYTCVATAKGRTAEQSHFLGIKGEKPTAHIVKPPVLGSFAMQCVVTGYPAPHIHWDFVPEAHNNHGLPPDVESRNTPYQSTLFVKMYKPVDHTGRWICIAINSAGNTTSEVHIP